MDTKLLVLKLFLDALGIDDSIQTVDDRKRVQKGIYLGQLSGVDLGYRFGWYRMGPYCPSLTKDYFALENELEVGSVDPKSASLNSTVLDRIQSVRPILSPPSGVDTSQENWLELLASVHFLSKVSRRTPAEVQDVLRTQKPHIASYYSSAVDILTKHKFLN